MALIETNDYRNPVGSVSENQSSYKIGGDSMKFGVKPEHVGNFSDDNPYLSQLNVANRKQDRAALYERAVEWEANRAALLEQREYDDPLAQIARQRKAGINPDVVGATSGSSGTSSGSAAHQSPVQGQTKFGNPYDTAATVFDGINTASNFISSLAGGSSAIIDGICKMQMLPAQRSLVDAQSGLVNAQSNEVNTLLAGKKVAQDISNSSAYLQQLASVAQVTSADTSDEDLLPFLRGIGLSEEQIADATKVVKQMHSNPEQLAKFYSDTNALRANKAHALVYTQEAINELTNLAYKIQSQKMAGDFFLQNIQTKVAEILDNEDYVANVAELSQVGVELGIKQAGVGFESLTTQSKSLEVQREQLKTALSMAKRDYDAFAEAQIQRTIEITELKAREKVLLDKYMSDGIMYSHERAVLDSMHAEIVALTTMNSSQMFQLHHQMMSSAQKYFGGIQFVSEKGLNGSDSFRKSYSDFAGFNFSSILLSGPTSEQMSFDKNKFKQQMILEYDKYWQGWLDCIIPF